MNHDEHATQLKQFRQAVYQNFNKRADTLMDLLDALSSNTAAHSVVELSLNPVFRRTYSALFTALEEWEPDRADKTLAQLAAPYLPKPARLPFWLLGTDVTPQPRLHARTLADRSYAHQPNVLKSHTPVTDTIGRVTRTEYDWNNRPVTVTVNYVDGLYTDARPFEDVQSVTQYDKAGNVLATTQYFGSSLARTTATLYDALNRPISQTVNLVGNGLYDPTKPDQNITTLTRYDGVGNVISTTQFYQAPNLQRTTLTLYDPVNRPISTTVNYTGTGQYDSAEPDQNITTLTAYDQNGNVISTTQFYQAANLARSTLTLYDKLDRPISTTVNYTGSGQFDPVKPIKISPHSRPTTRSATSSSRRSSPTCQTWRGRPTPSTTPSTAR